MVTLGASVATEAAGGERRSGPGAMLPVPLARAACTCLGETLLHHMAGRVLTLPQAPPSRGTPAASMPSPPGPTHPAFSTRLPMGGFGPAGGEWALLVWRGWELYVQAGWGGLQFPLWGDSPPL